MANSGFTFASFLIRLLVAIVLVAATWNPEGYSYYHWVIAALPDIDPYKALAGIALLAGWLIYLRATLRSLGLLGLGLLGALVAVIIWMLIDLGWLQSGNVRTVGYLTLGFTAFILALGISWSHIRRRITGQVDTDDLEN